RWLAFYVTLEKAVKKIAISGGPAVTVCKLDTPPLGLSWYRDHIVFGDITHGIMRVSENGGTPEVLVSITSGPQPTRDIKPEEGPALNPQILEDGRNVLFTLADNVGPERWDQGEVVVQSLSGGDRRLLLHGGVDAHYVPS